MFKRFTSYFFGAAILLLSSQHASATLFTLGNDGVDSTVSSLLGSETAVEYYDFYTGIGHPDFERRSDSGYFWLYEDSRNGDVSLGVLLDDPDASTSGGHARITFDNLPSSFHVDVNEEGVELAATGTNSAYGDWRWWPSYGDGSLIGGLEGNLWDISVVIHEYSGINDWFFVNGPSAYSTDLIMLNGEEFTLATIPEPSALFLIAAGLMGWTFMRRKHMVATKLH